jgi:hypothetical protein
MNLIGEEYAVAAAIIRLVSRAAGAKARAAQIEPQLRIGIGDDGNIFAEPVQHLL